jgi:hypothetical protein
MAQMLSIFRCKKIQDKTELVIAISIFVATPKNKDFVKRRLPRTVWKQLFADLELSREQEMKALHEKETVVAQAKNDMSGFQLAFIKRM